MGIPLPKISVIVPVYNVEKYVERCLESIVGQSYENLEIIVVDDGSTDKSGDICREYAKKDNRIILIRQENQGLSMARNNAIDIACGEYIGFVDSDDWIAPDMFEFLYVTAITYDAEISSCKIKSVSGDGSNISDDRNEDIILLKDISKIAHNMRNSNHSVCDKLFMRHLFDGIYFPKDKIYEDLFTTYKLLDKANKAAISSKEKYFYLSRGESITRRAFTSAHVDVIDASVERYEYISPRYPELEKECRNYIFSNLLWLLDKAYSDGKIEEYSQILQKAIDTTRRYDYTGCGLSSEHQNTLKRTFNKLRSYTLARRLFNVSSRGNYR